jgi:hypothetical protein
MHPWLMSCRRSKGFYVALENEGRRARVTVLDPWVTVLDPWVTVLDPWVTVLVP